MSILIIKNIPAEGPGTIEEHLKSRRMPYRILEFSKGEKVSDIAKYSHLIVMGGPMAVYEMDRYPYLRPEASLIKDFIENGKSVLGICLGAQMIAHALGAKVYPGGTQEVGWYNVDITTEGMEDPAVRALSVNNSRYAEVFQWHGDTFELPVDAVRIASSVVYQNQAFRYGRNVYALQFHIEVTPEIIREWFENEKGVDVNKMLKQTNGIFPEYYKRAMNFYENFFS
ncbi:MAG TPA: GMP synthase [Nitrospirae bacterium]|nr:GMP synthase [Nitrospirota bacterium]